MIASYSDHVERKPLCAVLVANSACLAGRAASHLGVDPDKLLADVAQSIRQCERRHRTVQPGHSAGQLVSVPGQQDPQPMGRQPRLTAATAESSLR
jgi:hypothetical protein